MQMEKIKENGGQLEVRVLCARDLKSVELFGRQDPYFKVIVGANAPWQSRVSTDAGRKPVWNETNRFPVTSKDTQLRLEVWDHNTVTTDSLIGGAIVPLQNVMTMGSESSRVIICDQRGRTAGEVEIVLVFTKDAKKDKLGAYGQPTGAGYPGQPMPGAYPNQPAQVGYAGQPAPSGYPAPHVGGGPIPGQPGYGAQPGQHPVPVATNMVSPNGVPHSYAPPSGPQGYPAPSAPPTAPYGAAPQPSAPYGAAPNPYGAPTAQPANPYGAAPANPYGGAPYGAPPPANPYGTPTDYGGASPYPSSSSVFGAPPPGSNPSGPVI